MSSSYSYLKNLIGPTVRLSLSLLERVNFDPGINQLHIIFSDIIDGVEEPSPFEFDWSATHLIELILLFNDLNKSLDDSRFLRRFEFIYRDNMDYIPLDTRGESDLHFQLQNGLAELFKSALQNLAGSIGDADVRQRLQNVKPKGSARIHIARIPRCLSRLFFSSKTSEACDTSLLSERAASSDRSMASRETPRPMFSAPSVASPLPCLSILSSPTRAPPGLACW